MFGSSSVAAIALALLKRRLAVDETPEAATGANSVEASSKAASVSLNALIAVLALVAVLSGAITIGIGDVNVAVETGDTTTTNTITGGEGSTNVIVGGQGSATVGAD